MAAITVTVYISKSFNGRQFESESLQNLFNRVYVISDLKINPKSLAVILPFPE